MLFEIKNCYVADVRDSASGVSQNGNAWTKATVIIEHKDGNYTDTYPMQAFGEKVQQAEALKGGYADVKFDIRGREYNGRWYTDVRLQFIKPVLVEGVASGKPTPVAEPQTQTQDDGPDLPF